MSRLGPRCWPLASSPPSPSCPSPTTRSGSRSANCSGPSAALYLTSSWRTDRSTAGDAGTAHRVSCYVATLLLTVGRSCCASTEQHLHRHGPARGGNPVEQVQLGSFVCCFGAVRCCSMCAGDPRPVEASFRRVTGRLLRVGVVSLAALSVGGIRPWPGIGVVQAVTPWHWAGTRRLSDRSARMRLARTDIGGLLVEPIATRRSTSRRRSPEPTRPITGARLLAARSGPWTDQMAPNIALRARTNDGPFD